MGPVGKVALAVGVTVALFGGFAGYKFLEFRRAEEISEAEQALAHIEKSIAAAERRQADLKLCKLDHVPVFIYRTAIDESLTAKQRGASHQDLVAIMNAHESKFVDSGTRCVVIDADELASQVRITSGPHAGVSGWVVSDWRRMP